MKQLDDTQHSISYTGTTETGAAGITFLIQSPNTLPCCSPHGQRSRALAHTIYVRYLQYRVSMVIKNRSMSARATIKMTNASAGRASACTWTMCSPTQFRRPQVHFVWPTHNRTHAACASDMVDTAPMGSGAPQSAADRSVRRWPRPAQTLDTAAINGNIQNPHLFVPRPHTRQCKFAHGSPCPSVCVCVSQYYHKFTCTRRARECDVRNLIQ